MSFRLWKANLVGKLQLCLDIARWVKPLEKETANLQASCKPLAEHGGNLVEIRVQGGRSNTSHRNLVALTVTVAEFLSNLFSITSMSKSNAFICLISPSSSLWKMKRRKPSSSPAGNWSGRWPIGWQHDKMLQSYLQTRLLPPCKHSFVSWQGIVGLYCVQGRWVVCLC